MRLIDLTLLALRPINLNEKINKQANKKKT